MTVASQHCVKCLSFCVSSYFVQIDFMISFSFVVFFFRLLKCHFTQLHKVHAADKVQKKCLFSFINGIVLLFDWNESTVVSPRRYAFAFGLYFFTSRSSCLAAVCFLRACLLSLCDDFVFIFYVSFRCSHRSFSHTRNLIERARLVNTRRVYVCGFRSIRSNDLVRAMWSQTKMIR